MARIQKESKKQLGNKPPTITEAQKKTPNRESVHEGYKVGILWGSWRERDPSQEFLTSLARELVRWVKEDEKAYRLEKFCIMKELHRGTLYKWSQKSEDLLRAIEMAKMVIAERRESGAIERRLDATAVFKVQAHYDEVYKEVVEWNSKLNNQDSLDSTQRIVVVERMPNSPLVPEKKDE